MLGTIDRFWRLIATAFCYIFFGVGGAILPWLAIPFIYLWPGTQRQKQQRVRHLIHYIFKFFIYLMRGLGVLTWNTEDIERLSRPGLLVIANHPTLIDVVFLMAFMRHADCVVKGALRRNPAMRGFVYFSGFIANDSGDNLIRGAKKTLEEGNALVIFPEGTRTTADNQPPCSYKFQRGAANIATRAECDITPVSINCTPPTLSKQHKWYYVPLKKVELTFKVHRDIAIAPYLHEPATVAARKLTRDLENYYTAHSLGNTP